MPLKKSGKRLLLIICIISLPIIAAGIYFIIEFEKKTEIMVYPPVTVTGYIRASAVIPYIEDGDIILRMTDGTWSSVFSDYSLTDKRFSHVGIVRKRNDKISVIHSVGSFGNKSQGVDEISLEYFLRVASSVGVFRVKKINGSVISDAAEKYIGRPFDFNFDLSDASSIYCTELLYWALKDIKSEHILATRYVEDIGKDIIPLDSISTSPDIVEIVYIVRQTGQSTTAVRQQDNPVIQLKDNPGKIKIFKKLFLIFRKFRTSSSKPPGNLDVQ